jgi:hypothetical protein
LRKVTFITILMLLLLSVAWWGVQAQPEPRVEITGIDVSGLPTAVVLANVYDNLGQPIRGLGVENFSVVGDLVEEAQIVSVENISDDNLPFSTVLVIDVSGSMEGFPLDRAKEAARTFVDNVRANDAIAIVAFSSSVRLLQPFTTDKELLKSVIDSLVASGETALYQAAFSAVEVAAGAPSTRHAVILLSDGAEYGGESTVGRGAALESALAVGVPVYTIGLGFGADRTYLQELSAGTNALFYESPTGEELVSIYADLAALLSSQYVITLNVGVPLDGTEYALGLQVNLPNGAVSTSGTLRAPIPVPIVRLSVPTEPISAPVEITADVLGDDAINGLNFVLQDASGTPGTSTDDIEAPYTFAIDPLTLQPGAYTLVVNANDENGDVGSTSAPITIAALPSQVTFTPDLATVGEIAAPLQVTLGITGQTAPASVSYNLNGGEAIPLEDPYQLTIDPLVLQPGENTLNVEVTNAGGVTSTFSAPFTVAVLPPVVQVEGLSEGDTVTENRTITVTATSQTPVVHVAVFVDGVEQAHLVSAPFTFDLNVLAFTPGQHTLRVSVDNSGGGSTTVEIPFTISPDPAQTATSVVVQAMATQEAIFTATAQQATLFAQATATSVQATQFAQATATQETIFTATAQAQATATREAEETATAQAQATATSVQATVEGQQTATQAVVFAEATAQQAALTATANAEATATVEAQQTATRASALTATAEAEATLQAQQTSTREAALTATANAEATATVEAQQTATRASALTATAIAEATLEAQQTATAITEATATREAELTATSIAEATQEAQSTVTREAELTATLEAQQTGTAVAQASETRAAELGATATQQSLDATATFVRNATQTAAVEAAQTARAETLATATEQAAAVATQTAQVTPTETATDTFTPLPTASPTPTLDARASATAQQALIVATGNARATAEQGTLIAITEQAQASATAANATGTAAQGQIETVVALTQNPINTRAAELFATVTQIVSNNATATADAGATATASAITATAVRAVTLDAAVQAAQTARADSLATATEASLQSAQVVAVTEFAQTAAATATEMALETTRLAQTAAAVQVQAVTARAIEQATQEAQLNATNTVQAGTTATQQINFTQTALAGQAVLAQATQNAAGTSTAQAEATVAARTSTAAADATNTAFTATAQAQATQASQPSPTATATEAEPTTVAQIATASPVPTTALPTASPTPNEEDLFQTATQIIVAATATASALTQVQTESTPPATDFAPILVVVFIALILILLAFFLLRRRTSR